MPNVCVYNYGNVKYKKQCTTTTTKIETYGRILPATTTTTTAKHNHREREKEKKETNKLIINRKDIERNYYHIKSEIIAKKVLRVYLVFVCECSDGIKWFTRLKAITINCSGKTLHTPTSNLYNCTIYLFAYLCAFESNCTAAAATEASTKRSVHVNFVHLNMFYCAWPNSIEFDQKKKKTTTFIKLIEFEVGVSIWLIKSVSKKKLHTKQCWDWENWN